MGQPSCQDKSVSGASGLATYRWNISGLVGSWHLTSSGKRCNILTGLRAGFKHGQYLQLIHNWWNMHRSQADQAGKAPVLWWMMVKSKCRKTWQIDCISLPQTHHDKLYMLTMIGKTAGWLETYPVPHATAWNTTLGLEKQSCRDMVLWKNWLRQQDSFQKHPHRHLGHSIEWVHNTPYHTPVLGKLNCTMDC